MVLPARVIAIPTSVPSPSFGPLLKQIAQVRGVSEEQVRTEFLAHQIKEVTDEESNRSTGSPGDGHSVDPRR